jgi:uncharacterized membrane-anchored protein YhcB (DUF1043 family)
MSNTTITKKPRGVKTILNDYIKVKKELSEISQKLRGKLPDNERFALDRRFAKRAERFVAIIKEGRAAGIKGL